MIEKNKNNFLKEELEDIKEQRLDVISAQSYQKESAGDSCGPSCAHCSGCTGCNSCGVTTAK